MKMDISTKYDFNLTNSFGTVFISLVEQNEDRSLRGCLIKQIEDNGFEYSPGLQAYWQQDISDADVEMILEELDKIQTDYLVREYIEKLDKHVG